MDVFGRTFVIGTRSEEAAEGGGRRAPPGRGGAELNVGGFNRGGLLGLGGAILEEGVVLFCVIVPAGGGVAFEVSSTLDSDCSIFGALTSNVGGGIVFSLFKGISDADIATGILAFKICLGFSDGL